MIIIYKISNTVNNKLYIGQTCKPLKVRWANHLCFNSSGCVKLTNAMKKYGILNFIMKPLIVVNSQEIANYWEVYFIRKFNSIKNGYNIREGGSDGKLSEETKNKMSESHIGLRQSDETRNKKSLTMMGNSNALGKKYSISTRFKMSESGKINQCGENNNAAKLSNNMVSKIRYSKETNKILAIKYKVSTRTIRRIKAYQTYK